jgi:phosphatidylserine/phosphatidylglycerophosphate/cardiolipin synthase-like enzyme
VLINLVSCGIYKLQEADVNLFVNLPPELKSNNVGKWLGNCHNDLCISLLDTLNHGQKTIDIAVYGLKNQPEISQALNQALNRGVKIRLVYDQDLLGKNYYQTEKYLDSSLLKNSVHDRSDAIMHNKFVIVDKCMVWTSSGSFSSTDTGGYNANTALIINSCYLGKIYEQEFSQLYSGIFQNRKKAISSKQVNLNNGGKVQVFFSPKSDTIHKIVIPMLESANQSINLPMFYFTHNDVLEALRKAQARGVKIRVILDASAAENNYVLDEELRAAGIPTKIENWGGKMHMKVAVIDNKHIITGSMNFTKAGNSRNDENTVILWDVPQLAAKMNTAFAQMWDSIPNQYLEQSPLAESKNSLNSCFDGIDNDFDQQIDNNDSDCFD